MDERMIKLMEEQNALLREMNGKLDDVVRCLALDVINKPMNINFTEETIDYLENYAKQLCRKR